MTNSSGNWPVLHNEMKRFLNFKRKSKVEYNYPTSEELSDPAKPRIPKFWQKFTCEEMEKLEKQTHAGLQDVLQRERTYNRVLSVQLEKLEKQREIELMERHLWAIIEENRSLLEDRENIRKQIEKETRASKATLDELSKPAKETPTTSGDEEKQPMMNLLEKVFGCEEKAKENLKKCESDILDKISSAKCDKDLNKVKSLIAAKQGVLLYALCLAELLRYQKRYPGLEETDGITEKPVDRKRKDTQPVDDMITPPTIRRFVKPEAIFRWDPRTLENLEITQDVHIFRREDVILETDV